MADHTIKIKIEDDETTLLELTACVPEHVGKSMMQQFGFYIDEPRHALAQPVPLYRRVKCKFRDSCIEDSEKCIECDNNDAKSYFVAK